MDPIYSIVQKQQIWAQNKSMESTEDLKSAWQTRQSICSPQLISSLKKGKEKDNHFHFLGLFEL